MSEPKEAVNHPSHYTFGKIEVIEAIEDWRLGFNLGNAVKYIARAEHKGRAIEDLRKAKWYLEREIAARETSEPSAHPSLNSCVTCGHTKVSHLNGVGEGRVGGCVVTTCKCRRFRQRLAISAAPATES